MAELDGEIDPFATYQRPVPGSNLNLGIEEKKTGNQRKSRGKLDGCSVEKVESVGSRMSFGSDKLVVEQKIFSRNLNSNTTLNSDLKVQNVSQLKNSIAKKTRVARTQKEEQFVYNSNASSSIVASNANLYSGKLMPFEIANKESINLVT